MYLNDPYHPRFFLKLLACGALLIASIIPNVVAAGATSQPTTTESRTTATTRNSARADYSNSTDLTTLSLEDLMNVQVTSVSKAKQRIADAPAAVTLISQEDIARSGLHEIPEILRLSPGVFVQQGNQLTTWSVATRGFAQLFSNKLLVLEDGRTLYTPFFSGVYWDMVDYPIPDLDRIEVIRGPGATLWGSNAVNGVININSKSAQDTQGLMVDSRVGTDSSDLAIRYGGKLDDKTYYRVWGKGRSFDDNADAQDQWDDGRGGFRIDRLASDKDTLTLQSDVAYQSISNNHVPGNPNPIPNYGHDYHSDGNMLGKWTHVDSDTNDYSVQVYYDRTQERDPFVTYWLDTVDADFQDRFALLERNELVWGLGGRLQHDQIGTFFLPAPLVQPSHRTTQQISGFIQDAITIVPDRLSFFIGSKFEYDSFGGFNVQPSARLLWTPKTTTSLWASVSRAVRTPARWEEDSNFLEPIPAATPTFVQVLGGSGDVKPEDLIAYELGYRQQLAKAVSFDVTAYANDYKKLISVMPLAAQTVGPLTILPEQWVNGQTAENYGAEVAVNWQVVPSWRLGGSYSFMESFVHNGPGIAASQIAVLQNSYPMNMFQVHSYWDITRHIQCNASVYYASSIGPSGVPVANGTGPGNSSNFRADFNIVWNPTPGLDLTLGVQNAFDPQHAESTTGEGSTAEIRRAAYAEATWKY
jgi:iron complex outermembrane receptor protein